MKTIIKMKMTPKIEDNPKNADSLKMNTTSKARMTLKMKKAEGKYFYI